MIIRVQRPSGQQREKIELQHLCDSLNILNQKEASLVLKVQLQCY